MKLWRALLLMLFFSGSVTAQNLRLGDTIPVFEALTDNAAPFVLDSALKRPMVILLWATWNEPSRQVLDELKQLYASINPVKRAQLQLNIDFIDFCMDTRQDLHQIVLKRENLPWPIHLADYKGWESEMISTLRIRKIPTLIVIDQNRKVLVLDPDVKQIRNILLNIRVNEQLSN
jgi:thiol-disulfide isomerase/thioredoxin